MGKTPLGLTVLEKKGLHQVAGILENYGIDSETDVSLFDRDDFSKLSSNGIKSIEGKKIVLTLCVHVSRTQGEQAPRIKSFEERKDSQGKDTFDLSDWWKSNCATLPTFVP